LDICYNAVALTGGSIHLFHDSYYPSDRFILPTGTAGELTELIEG
jgi:hypothetical protein